MAVTVVPRPTWCLTPGSATYNNQPTFGATVLCAGAGSGAPWQSLSAMLVTMRWQTQLCCCERFLTGKLASKHAPTNHDGRLPGCIAAAAMPNWLLLCVHRFGTSWRYDVWRWWQQTWRNRARRQGDLLNAISCVNRAWRLTLSYGCHEAPLPAFKHTTISQHTMWQVSIVKTRKNYH